MAKTLREFYDDLSVTSKNWFRDKCDLWFNEFEPNCVRKYKPVTENMKDFKYKSSYTPKSSYSYYSSDTKMTDLEAMWVANLIHLRDELKVITDEQVAEALKEYYSHMKEFHNMKLFLACKERSNQIDVLKYYLDKNYDNDEGYPLKYGLFMVNDYSNIINELNFEAISIRSLKTSEFVSMIEIFGDKSLEILAEKNPKDFAQKYKEMQEEVQAYQPKQEYIDLHKKMQDIFDRKFFVDNSWTRDDKRDIIKQMYASDWIDRALRRFEDFAKDILSVDHRYSKMIYMLVQECPSLGNKIYEAKKPNEEINPNDPVDMTFRYSKEIRKLGKIANICARESLSKANNGFLKDIGSIIRLTGYNFNEIYNMMYPDEIEAVI